MVAAAVMGVPCENITENDALFIVDTQNDFMESFPVRSKPANYDISGHIKDGR